MFRLHSGLNDGLNGLGGLELMENWVSIDGAEVYPGLPVPVVTKFPLLGLWWRTRKICCFDWSGTRRLWDVPAAQDRQHRSATLH